MPSELLERKAAKRKRSRTTQDTESATPAVGLVLVKTDSPSQLAVITPHALVVAQALGKRLRLVDVLHYSTHDEIPVDPIEWDMRKRQSLARLSEFIAQYSDATCEIDIRVVDNCTPSLARGPDDAFNRPVLCFIRTGAVMPWDHNDTARQMMQSGCHSVLLVPDSIPAAYPVFYRRIAVTLDGSSRAECVIPIAIALARHQGAELVVLHAVPDPGLTQTGPLDSEALELCERLKERNQRIAQDYLAGIRASYETDVEKLTTRLIKGSDVRHQLVNAARSESVDLLLLASHGSTGHREVPLGSVAQFLLEYATVPMLMLGGELAGVQADSLSNKDLSSGYRSVLTSD